MTALFGSFLVAAIIGIPIAFAFGIAAVAYLHLTGAMPIATVVQRMALSAESWPLLAIPFFMVMGELFMRGGMGRRTLSLISASVGWLPGGLAAVCIVCNLFLAGVSGASLADAVAIGAVLIPEMQRKGYPPEFIVALHATSATLGVIIPPSIPMIMYAWMTNTSVRDLFLAGIIPGLLVALALLVVTVWISWRENYPREPWPGFKAWVAQLLPNTLAFLAPVVVLGGIIAGVFTATEAAVVGCLYVLVCEGLFYRELSLKDVWKSVVNAAMMTGASMLLLATAAAFGTLMALLRLPEQGGAWISSMITNNTLMLLAINVWLLIQGLFLELIPALLLTTPILQPLAQEAGMHPVQFGVVMTMNLAMGMFTPPVGSVLFACCVLGRVSMEKVTPYLMPFFFAILAVLMLVTYVPVLTMWPVGR